MNNWIEDTNIRIGDVRKFNDDAGSLSGKMVTIVEVNTEMYTNNPVVKAKNMEGQLIYGGDWLWARNLYLLRIDEYEVCE